MDPRARDRLIPEEKRRREGAFYTPKPFVGLAHKYIADVFGENWREEYIVYDPAAGTGNLTRDYRFKELYISTIDQSDIDTMNQMGYNPNAVKFQFDFLNDPDEKMPAELLAALRGERDKQVIVLMNPPYGTAGSVNKRSGHKAGIAKTKVREQMEKAKAWGRSRQQLFAQFYYRLSGYEGVVHQAAFTSPIWLTGGSHKSMRAGLKVDKRYAGGFTLQASEFADVSGTWAISFTILSGLNLRAGGTGRYGVDVYKTKLDGPALLATREIYNVDKLKPVRGWIVGKTASGGNLLPKLSSALVVRESSSGYELPAGNLGLLVSDTNNVGKNGESVFFLTGGTTTKLGKYAVTEDNILKSTALFTARKSVGSNWVNHFDEYLAPNEDHPLYQQFVADSVIYSLFNNSSEQSSLRNVEYKGKLHNIYNEFFWTLPTMMQQEADKHGFDALYQDARYGERRYVEKLLSDGDLFMDTSPLASDVYYAAEKLFIHQCMPYRQLLHEEHPEYHLNAWDAGYSQLKRVAQKFLPEEFKEFRKLYLEFEEYLRPQVYELGFLLGDGSEVDLLKWK